MTRPPTRRDAAPDCADRAGASALRRQALQAKQLEPRLLADGHDAALFGANCPLPAAVAKLPGLRTLARLLLIGPKLWRVSRDADVVHVLAASWF